MSAVDDDIAEGDHSAVIGHSVASADLAYHRIDVPLHTVNITDNDTAGVVISASGTTLGVTEGGDTTTYTVVLTSEPTAKVTVTLDAGDQLVLVPTEIVFSADDWDQPRTVVVRALDDSIAEGNHTAIITHTLASGDTNYDGLDADSIPVAITDNDEAGLVITQTSGSTDVSESGQSDVYTLKLASQPTSTVTIQLQTDGQVKTLPSTVTFTTSNWNQAQTIAVTAVSDLVAEGTHTGTISHIVNSSDLNYAGLTTPDLEVTITDNDTAGVVITQTGSGSAVTEGGATDTYTVVLATQPTADVTISMVPTSDVTTNPVQLTFTSANWDTPQTVTISAIDDTLDEDATETVAINHVLTTDDEQYAALTASPVWVVVTDNDEGTIVEELNLVGTSGNDTLEIVRGDVLTVTLNDTLIYEGTDVTTITFDGP